MKPGGSVRKIIKKPAACIMSIEVCLLKISPLLSTTPLALFTRYTLAPWDKPRALQQEAECAGVGWPFPTPLLSRGDLPNLPSPGTQHRGP